jgi:serine phosphatase RsbU (regulator of sigma subunit)
MRSSGHLTSSYPSIWRLLTVSSLLFFVFYIYDKTSFSYVVENRVSLPGLFKIRDLLGNSGELTPKLKIFSYDDTTLGALGKADLSMLEWAEMLSKISERKPRAIYIDKLFALNSASDAEYSQAIDRLKSIETPVITISFVSPNNLPYRKELVLDDRRYDILSLFQDKFAMMTSSFVPMLDRIGWNVYGPHETLQPFFNRVGHALNADSGKADPLIQIGPKKMLPHAVFVGPFELSVIGTDLFAGGHKVPTDVNGKVVVNFFQRKSFYTNSTRILSIIRELATNSPLSAVSPGDTVLILPSMFTGSTDFIRTPLGPMPGGYVIASLLNSLMINRWIEPTRWEGWTVFVACLLGVPVVFFMGSFFWVYLAFCLIAYGVSAVYLFTYQGMLINISVPVGAYLTSVLTFITFRNQVREKLMFFMRVLKTENDELRSEIDQATQIASVFNPDRPPSWGQLKVSSHHETLIAASGDWHAFEESPSGAFRHILMCDITGHGVQAAIIVSACKTVLSLVTQEFPEYLEGFDFFEHYIRLLNSTLFVQGKGHHITTLVGVSINLAAKKAKYIAAGHPPPFLFRKEESSPLMIFSMNSRHNPIGLFPEIFPECSEVLLTPGDTIVIYTDGLPIPRNPRQLVPAVHNMIADGVADDSATRLVEQLKQLAKSQVRTSSADDLSLVVLHWESRSPFADDLIDGDISDAKSA